MIRPTADRIREAMFNIIGAELTAARVIDLFAGTGSLGLEALSRGAAEVLFVDHCRSAVELIRKNVTLCGFSDRCRICKRDLLKGLFFLDRYQPPEGFGLVFMDPPYGRKLIHRLLPALADGRLLSPDGLVVAEESAGECLPEVCGDLQMTDRRRYGDTGVWIYRKSAPAARLRTISPAHIEGL